MSKAGSGKKQLTSQAFYNLLVCYAQAFLRALQARFINDC